jgi:hypothetical protein
MCRRCCCCCYSGNFLSEKLFFELPADLLTAISPATSQCEDGQLCKLHAANFLVGCCLLLPDKELLEPGRLAGTVTQVVQLGTTNLQYNKCSSIQVIR